MEDPYAMPGSSIQEILHRLSQKFSMAKQWEALPPPTLCPISSFHGRLRHKSAAHPKFCEMKLACKDCTCVPPNHAKEPTVVQTIGSPMLTTKIRKRGSTEVYAGFESGKISKKKIQNNPEMKFFLQRVKTRKSCSRLHVDLICEVLSNPKFHPNEGP